MSSIYSKRFPSSLKACLSTSTNSSIVATAAAAPGTNGRRRIKALVHDGYSNGVLPYSKGWAWQQALLQKRLQYQRSKQQQQEEEEDEDVDRILLLQHDHVYTLGRGAKEEHLTFLGSSGNINVEKEDEKEMRWKLSRKARGKHSARLSVDRQQIITPQLDCIQQEVDQLSESSSPVHAPNGAPIYRIERGGEVTYHGPGQLVVYPLLNLRHPPYQKDLHWYLRQVEQVILLTLQHYNIHGVRDKINTGVWVQQNKIAAVGISSSRWITTHGFALNVHPALEYFDTSVILPCGIEGRGVTSIAQELKGKCGESTDGSGLVVPTMKDVARVVIQSFEQVFGVTTQPSSLMLK